MKKFIDLKQDTWAACDDLKRELPLNVASDGTDRKVGIFYFIWHEGNGPLFDHTLAYTMGGIEEFEKTLTMGSRSFAHYWAEPYFGYYRSDDEWVIRKHAYQLADAGIDFIFFDVTNGLIYKDVMLTVLKVWDGMRKEGYKTPQIMFHCGDSMHESRCSFNAVWDAVYSKGLYKDLWFEWENKPIIFAPRCLVETLNDEQKNFFTFRCSWAGTGDAWYTATNGSGAWPWADMHPQQPGKSDSGEVEQAVVMCGFWANGSFGTNAGRSYSNGKQPHSKNAKDYAFSLIETTTPLGLAYQEQFDHAVRNLKPSVLMITGWNEWWAGRWDNTLPDGGNPAQGQTIANTYIVEATDERRRNYYVDNLNGEYSRDIEACKGLFKDNYYYQTVMNIRNYKGTRPVPFAENQKSIDIYGNVSQWADVGPEYLDYKGDTVKRDCASHVGGFHYTNDSGRNDLVTMKVSIDDENVYFYAECAEDITAPEGTNWMNLFINADRNPYTGWHGYDFIVNRYQSGDKASVEAFKNGKWEFETVCDAEYSVNKNVIQIKIPKSVLGIGKTFEFKWADNSVIDGDIMEFIDKGDCAPNERFNYVYVKK